MPGDDQEPRGGRYPRRGTRAHRAYVSARREAADISLTLLGDVCVDTVELVNSEDVYGHLVRGSSVLTGQRGGCLAHFERRPGEVPAVDGW